jgi:MFS family permease
VRFYIYIFAFIFSLATILLQRGVFFYTQYELGMGDSQNLLLALAVGITYIAGAQLSHRFWESVGPRRSIFILVAVQLILPLIAFFFAKSATVSVVVVLYSFFNGMTWPVAESYASAGLDEKQSSKSIGIYNLCWSTAVPLSVWMSGALISGFKNGIFLACGIIVVFAMALVFFLPKVIPHHVAVPDSGGRDDDEKAIAYDDMKRMLVSSRWSMGFSYALMQILTALLPGKFHAAGISVAMATIYAGFVDASRTLAFLLMSSTHWWHGKKTFLVLVSLTLALGFCACMFGDMIPLILAGEIIYGLAAGFAYYSALYYAMILSKASVGAGGSHESVIGAGFTVGPIVVIAGKQIACVSGLSVATGLAFGVVPMILTAVPVSILCLLPRNSR